MWTRKYFILREARNKYQCKVEKSWPRQCENNHPFVMHYKIRIYLSASMLLSSFL